MYVDAFMTRAIELSAQALTEKGCEPFGAVVVKDGRIVGEGYNHAVQRHDPTSHSEIEAIRDACRNLTTVDLSDTEMYTSCEPCALCVAAMLVAGVERVYYAVTLEQSDAALAHLGQDKRPYEMDAAALRVQVGLPMAERRLASESRRAEDAKAVIDAWTRAQESR